MNSEEIEEEKKKLALLQLKARARKYTALSALSKVAKGSGKIFKKLLKI